MKLETRIELAVVLVGAVVIGGWVGLKMVNKSKKQVAERPLVGETSEPAMGIMTAPPMEAPSNVDPQIETSAAPSAFLTTEVKADPQPVPPPTPAVAPERQTEADKLRDKIEAAAEPAFYKAMELLNAGNKFEARAILTKLIINSPEGPARDRLKTTLDKINAELFFSRTASPDSEMYEVRPGDSLAVIVKRFKKDYYFHNLVMQINGIRKANRIRVGQKIKIPTGKFSALVDKSSHRMIVFMNGHYIKEYPVGLGAQNSVTPATQFIVANNKQINPVWTAPNGKVYKYGHPENVLGTRWIGFKETGKHSGYGIHGTSDESSVGRNVSNGCLRMLQGDVEEVFTMLMPGDVVQIIE